MLTKWMLSAAALLMLVAPNLKADDKVKAQPAEETEGPADEGAHKPLRVGGDYQVSEIDRIRDDEFKIVFKAVTQTGKYDTLVLVSDHVNMKVEKGQVLRLSAEVGKEDGATAEVTQVLLFLPNGNTHVPMWMLSKHFPGRELRGSRYIEMHSPTSDYIVL
jgi:hypothetical protein